MEKTKKKPKEKTTKIDLRPEFIGAGIVLLVLLGFLLFSQGSGTVPPATAAEKLVTWLKSYFASQGLNLDVQVKSVRDVGSVYEVGLVLSLGAQREEVTYYVSKDAKYFFPVGISLEEVQEVAQTPQRATVSPPKSDRPTVELFVMSYCPYGMQMEKAIIPVLRLLGDKVDFTLRFVNYAMHGEKEVWENVRQYCIQREYGTEKLLDYLECFVVTNPDQPELCMSKLGIDTAKIEACMEEVNREYNIAELLSNRSLWMGGRYPPFPIDDQKNLEYGVRGSPTLVINGVTVSVTRSPEAVKQVICEAFNNPPEECNVTLDSTPTSPGFGGGTGSNVEAQCG